MKLRSAPGSEFVIRDSSSSAGIQLVDLILWLTKRGFDGREAPPEVKTFMQRVLRQTDPYEMSYEGTVATLESGLLPIMETPMSDEMLQKGQELLELSETRRTESMAQLLEESRDEQAGGVD